MMRSRRTKTDSGSIGLGGSRGAGTAAGGAPRKPPTLKDARAPSRGEREALLGSPRVHPCSRGRLAGGPGRPGEVR